MQDKSDQERSHQGPGSVDSRISNNGGVIVIVSAVAELERNLIIERVRAGLRRARLEGRVLGRRPIEIDRPALLRDRARGLSLAQLASAYRISRTSVARALKQSEGAPPSTTLPLALADTANTPLRQEHQAS
jgi:DNA invertase Pin-like site-specific DNA recombinase